LIIYECADHKNAADISGTWQQLLEATHLKVVNDPSQTQQPYEAVVTMVKDMADKLKRSESTFNPETIIELIEKYSVEHQNNVGPRTWVVDLFIEVKIPYETIVSVLQSMWYSNLAPFSAPIPRRKLAEHIVYTCKQWYEYCVRTNTIFYNSDDNAHDIIELLGLLQQSLLPQEVAEVDQLRNNISSSFR
jgi:nuclear pore complex protein Nup155